ncbi:diadenylate cyclase [Faecalibaculum rodentium]|uniref:diadenylate cyclase n=1 Tax=Faecalibaculum rodentium TaxID=1702221 RepID=UPI003F66162C
MTRSLQELHRDRHHHGCRSFSELLGTIFPVRHPDALWSGDHSGRENRRAAAYFRPPARDLRHATVPRHRQAVGISEITDSITIIVSEETGAYFLANAHS